MSGSTGYSLRRNLFLLTFASLLIAGVLVPSAVRAFLATHLGRGGEDVFWTPVALALLLGGIASVFLGVACLGGALMLRGARRPRRSARSVARARLRIQSLPRGSGGANYSGGSRRRGPIVVPRSSRS